eukprot:GHVU01096947.1.p1 GENE.GHVU01096947.1~~GHVU01096947.1.p1  ORF type:complete len:489 (+),score=118.89 GHVU01096947.1:142-1608(+)
MATTASPTSAGAATAPVDLAPAETGTAFVYGPDKKEIKINFKEQSWADKWEQLQENPMLLAWLRETVKNFNVEGLTELTVEELKLEDPQQLIVIRVPGCKTLVRLTAPQLLFIAALKSQETRKEWYLFETKPAIEFGRGSYLTLPTCTSTETELEGAAVAKFQELVGAEALDLPNCRFEVSKLSTGGKHGDASFHLANPKSVGGAAVPNEGPHFEVVYYRHVVPAAECSAILQKLRPSVEENELPKHDAEAANETKYVFTASADVWQTVVDSPSLGALFLLHELQRKDQLRRRPGNGRGGDRGGKFGLGGGPRSRPEDGPVVKRAPVFQKVGRLEPNSRGVSAYLKVVGAPETDKNVRPSTSRVAKVGDDSGRICLVVEEGPQTELCEEADAKVVVRNGHIRMIEGHMYLVVDRWAKISKAEEGEMENFDFEVGEKDLSEVEYELVGRDEGGSGGGHYGSVNEDGAVGGGGPARGRGGRGRRGRGRYT